MAGLRASLAGREILAWALAAVAILSAGLLCSCAHPPLANLPHPLQEAMRPVSAPHLDDDLDLPSLAAAVEHEADFIEKAPGFQSFTFGPRVCTKAEYLAGLVRFARLARSSKDREAFFEAVSHEFDFYQVYGDKEWGRVFMTSYYEAVVKGSRKRTPRLSRPLYRAPEDLVALDLKAFDPDKFSSERRLRGRVVEHKFVPYFSREEIDVKNALKGRKLELAWVDPIDAHDIQVQGSGVVEFPSGKTMRVGYADRNGLPYESVGKYVRDAIPKDQLSLQAIEDYLHGLSPKQMQDVLDKDGSYVFFKETGAPETSMGMVASAGRTIATDGRYFPKGGLAFLVSTKPKWDATVTGAKSYVPTSFEPFSRFVLDQDIGGAITGAGRLDLYWGSGDEAKRNAGVIKQDGQLFYLVPKAVSEGT